MTALPAHWRVARLSDVAAIIMGQSPPGSSYNGKGEGVPFFQGKSEFGNLTATVRKWTTAGTKLAKAGDILLSVRAPVGPTNLAPVDCALGRGLAGLHAGSDLEQRFLMWNLRAQEHAISALGKGSTFEAITGKQLRDVTVPVPPMEEQRRIVEILEDHLSRLDVADMNFSAVERRLGILRGRLLDCALEEAIANTSDVPTTSLGSLVAAGRKLAYGVLVPGPDLDDGVPFVRVGDLREGRVRESELKRISPDVSARFPRTVVGGGELLLSLVGTIGRTGIIPESLSGANVARAVGVLPLRDDVDTRFVSMLLEAPRSNRALNALAHEVARKTLNLEDVRRFQLPLPSLDVQRRIVAATDQKLVGIGRLQKTVVEARQRAAGLRRSLLGAAFSGQLT